MQKIYKSGTNRGLAAGSGSRRCPARSPMDARHTIWQDAAQASQWKSDCASRAAHKRPADARHVKRWHKVAGTDKRPIIDLNGAYLNDLFGNCALQSNDKPRLDRDQQSQEGLAQ